MTELAFFTHNLALGGAQRVVANLTNEFAERGIDTEIVLVEKRGELLSQIPKDVSVVDLDTDPVIQATRDLRSYLQRTRPDVLISTVNTANLMAMLAVKSTRTETRHIVRVANTLSKEASTYDNRLTDRPIPYLMRLLYPRADRLIAVSGGLADDLVTNFGVNQNRIDVIYNPTVTDSLLQQSEQEVDHRWLSDPQTNVVLGVGSLSEQKDFSTLLRAFSRINDPDRKLLILGEGSRRERLEALVTELGIDSDVSLPGAVSNPYPYMSQADLFVLSSRWEGCPNVLIEAMACGCPVVSTDCPHGPREILADGKYGPLVPVGDPKVLADQLVHSLHSPIESRKLSARANDFHVENIAEEYLSCVSRMSRNGLN